MIKASLAPRFGPFGCFIGWLTAGLVLEGGWGGVLVLGLLPLAVGFGSGSRRIWAGASCQDRKRWSWLVPLRPNPKDVGFVVGGYRGVELAGPGRPVVDRDPCLGRDGGDVDMSDRGGQGLGRLGRHRRRAAYCAAEGEVAWWAAQPQKTPPSKAAPASAAPTTSARRPRPRGTESVVCSLPRGCRLSGAGRFPVLGSAAVPFTGDRDGVERGRVRSCSGAGVRSAGGMALRRHLAERLAHRETALFASEGEKSEPDLNQRGITILWLRRQHSHHHLLQLWRTVRPENRAGEQSRVRNVEENLERVFARVGARPVTSRTESARGRTDR